MSEERKYGAYAVITYWDNNDIHNCNVFTGTQAEELAWDFASHIDSMENPEHDKVVPVNGVWGYPLC